MSKEKGSINSKLTIVDAVDNESDVYPDCKDVTAHDEEYIAAIVTAEIHSVGIPCTVGIINPCSPIGKCTEYHVCVTDGPTC
jgi:hypothetical protein